MAIVVKTKEEAWDKVTALINANAILGGPSSSHFVKNIGKSERAGYPIYEYPIDPRYYISDLNNRLELNTGSKTINIWIKPNCSWFYEEKKFIDKDKVFDCCINYNLFDKGSLKRFYELIKNIKTGEISEDAIFSIVNHIYDYTSNITFLTILNLINNECITHKYIEKEIKE